MKRKKFGQRPGLFPWQSVRQAAAPGGPRRASGVKQQRPSQKNRIFVVAQVGPFGRTSFSGGKQRHILIFDNHPESLRMVSRRHLSADLAHASFPPKHHDVILALFLMLLLAAAMFWPLLLA